jgi:hypothetical protein
MNIGGRGTPARTEEIALHFVYSNYLKIHKLLRAHPAIEAGLIKILLTIEDIISLAK